MDTSLQVNTWLFPRCNERTIPLNTWHNNNVVITSKRRHFDVITSKWRRFDVITTSLLRNVFAGIVSMNRIAICLHGNPDSKVHGAYMGPTWVLSAQDGPNVGPLNRVIREPVFYLKLNSFPTDVRHIDNVMITREMTPQRRFDAIMTLLLHRVSAGIRNTINYWLVITSCLNRNSTTIITASTNTSSNGKQNKTKKNSGNSNASSNTENKLDIFKQESRLYRLGLFC